MKHDPRPRWQPVPGAFDLPPGGLRAFKVDGHPLVYIVKARELLGRVGEEYARDILDGILHNLVLATREDTFPT